MLKVTHTTQINRSEGRAAWHRACEACALPELPISAFYGRNAFLGSDLTAEVPDS